MRTTWRVLAVTAALFHGVSAQAQGDVVLKAGVGRDIVEAYCGACHSLDYPAQNAHFLNRQGWETEVNKMINTFGAPIEPADAKTIIDYLSANYGTGG